MDTLELVGRGLLSLWVVVVLAHTLARVLYPREKSALSLGLGLTVVLGVLPLLSFGAGLLLHLPHNVWVLFGVATVIILTCGGIHLVKVRSRSKALE
jgi:hypothetical protein